MANILHNLLICVFIGKRLNLLSKVHHIPHKADPIILPGLVTKVTIHFFEDYFSRGVLGSHQKLGGRYRDFPHTFWPVLLHIFPHYQHSPSNQYICYNLSNLHWHLMSIVYLVHSLCYTSYGFGQMCNDIHASIIFMYRVVSPP